MTAPRLLVGLLGLALLSVLLIVITGSGDDTGTTSIALPAEEASGAEAAPSAETSAEQEPLFQDADLEAGLVALCSRDAQVSTAEESSRTFEEVIQPVVERLTASSSGEHLLAAALLQTDQASRFDLVERAVAAAPGDPLVLWSAVRICSDPRYSPDCPLREWEQRLIAVDGQNGESWVRVAANRYTAGEVSAALEAMRSAATAAESSIYWTEMIESIERGLRVAGDFSFFERADNAIGFAATQLPRYSGLTTMCSEQSPASPEWADACLKYGELAELRADTFVGVSIALSVQRLVLEAVGESARAAEVEERRLARDREFADAMRGMNATLELVIQDPTLFYSWLAMIRSEGEVAAARRVTADIERLILLRPELACR